MSAESGGCENYGDMWICSARGFSFRSIRYCKWCGERRRHLMTDELWYGMKIVCLGCGSTWDSDWGHHRMSQKRRHKARDRARALWKEAGTRAQHAEWLSYEFSLLTEDQDGLSESGDDD